MNEPKSVARMEIITNRKVDPHRITIPLDGESLLAVFAQLEHAGRKDGVLYEDDNTLIWVVGAVEWESEEHRAEYMSKWKFTKYPPEFFKETPVS